MVKNTKIIKKNRASVEKNSIFLGSIKKKLYICTLNNNIRELNHHAYAK